MHEKHTTETTRTDCLPDEEPVRLETCRKRHKSKWIINLISVRLVGLCFIFTSLFLQHISERAPKLPHQLHMKGTALLCIEYRSSWVCCNGPYNFLHTQLKCLWMMNPEYLAVSTKNRNWILSWTARMKSKPSNFCLFDMYKYYPVQYVLICRPY